ETVNWRGSCAVTMSCITKWRQSGRTWMPVTALSLTAKWLADHQPRVAGVVGQRVVSHPASGLGQPTAAAGAPEPVRPDSSGASLLQRARMLLLQGAAGILADQLGASLLRRSADAEGGAALRA